MLIDLSRPRRRKQRRSSVNLYEEDGWLIFPEPECVAEEVGKGKLSPTIVDRAAGEVICGLVYDENLDVVQVCKCKKDGGG